jgi:cobalt-precorrin-5B (C1)-methyltransferase
LLLRRDGGQDLQARRRRHDDPLDPLQVDNDLLAEITAKAGGPPDLIEESKPPTPPATPTSSGVRAGLEHAPHLLCEQAAENLAEYAEGKLEVHVILVDFDTLDPTGASSGALELTTWNAA